MAQVDACVVRKELAYEEKWRRFELGERKYGQQYSQVYFNRLNMMREQLKKAALQRWRLDNLGNTKYARLDLDC